MMINQSLFKILSSYLDGFESWWWETTSPTLERSTMCWSTHKRSTFNSSYFKPKTRYLIKSFQQMFLFGKLCQRISERCALCEPRRGTANLANLCHWKHRHAKESLSSALAPNTVKLYVSFTSFCVSVCVFTSFFMLQQGQRKSRTNTCIEYWSFAPQRWRICVTEIIDTHGRIAFIRSHAKCRPNDSTGTSILPVPFLFFSFFMTMELFRSIEAQSWSISWRWTRRYRCVKVGVLFVSSKSSAVESFPSPSVPNAATTTTTSIKLIIKLPAPDFIHFIYKWVIKRSDRSDSKHQL